MGFIGSLISLAIFFMIWDYLIKKLKLMFAKVKKYLKRVYRLSLSPAKREVVVWRDLKKLFAILKLRHGVFESSKHIEVGFGVEEGKGVPFFYSVDDGDFKCFVRVAEDFAEELTSDIFILATHFNNLLNHGMVTIDTDDRSVGFTMKEDALIPCLYPGHLHFMMEKHLDITRDLLYKAFQRLIHEDEAPAIIISDLLSELDNNKEE